MIWYRDVLLYKSNKEIDGVVFKDQCKYKKEQARKSSYEGIELILESLESESQTESECAIFDAFVPRYKRTNHMTKVIGVRFRTAGRSISFAGKLEQKTGDKVIVETARSEFGSVVADRRKWKTIRSHSR